MTLLDAARTFRSVFDDEATAPATTTPTASTTSSPTTNAPTEDASTDDAPVANAHVAAAGHSPSLTQSASFEALGVPSELVRALRKQEITAPFPIQTATIPDALAGRDVLGRGQTGSGKTLAFGLPMLARIAASGRSAPRRPKGLVLVPTRELAMQVNDALTPLAKALGLFTKTAFGGAPYSTQIFALERGVDVLVATPGRLGDLIEKGACSLGSVMVSVLDEADQMADMGFLPDVTRLLAHTPERAQRLLFSATLDGDVDALVKRFMTDPVTHEVDPAAAAVDTMDHHALLIPPRDKFLILSAIANRAGRTIMFVRTQMAVDRLVEQLAEVGVRAGALHGGKTQRVRTRTLAEFKEGQVNVLVATNVAARGIHVDGVSLVVHVDPPADSKDYLHRAGRTARAGEAGTVVTLVLPRQRKSTFTLLERAGVTAARTEVTVEAQALADVTGARRPSGVPVPATPPPSTRGRDDRGRDDRGRDDRRRPEGEYRRRPEGEFRRRPEGEFRRPEGGFRPARTFRPDGPRTDSARTDRPRTDRPRTDSARTDGARTDGARTEGYRADRPRTDSYRADGPRTDRPRTEGYRTDRPRTEGFRTDRPRTERPRTDGPRTDGKARIGGAPRY